MIYLLIFFFFREALVLGSLVDAIITSLIQNIFFPPQNFKYEIGVHFRTGGILKLVLLTWK